MTAVSIELFKQHLKHDDADLEDANELISLYLEAAEQWAGNYIGKPISDLDPVPADVKVAILKLASFYFEVRNIATLGVSAQLAPQNVASTLDSYREKWFTDGE